VSELKIRGSNPVMVMTKLQSIRNGRLVSMRAQQQQTANSKKQTANSTQQKSKSKNSKKQKQQTANSKQQIANSKQT
jgi:hypothetical protein